MPRSKPWNVPLVALALLAGGCGNELAETTAPAAAEQGDGPGGFPDGWPMSDDPILASGRSVWVENCENCHGIGKAGSPRFGDLEAWAPRVSKGLDVLIGSAINGFEGNSEGGMPPRGGEKDLTDEEVTAAVHYMVHFSSKH